MAKSGDKVRITTEKETLEGTLLPEDKGFLVLKLESGYNIGIDKKRVQKTEVLEEGSKKKEEEKDGIEQDQELPLISILHTGGTIASKVDYETGGVISKFTPEEILELFPELHDIARIDSRLVRNMASDDMRFAHYNILAEAVKKELEKDLKGIIITHGTDTLHHTAAALDFALENPPVPVILVGSQRSSDRGSSDAAGNLIAAAHFIKSTDFVGVAACMHASTEDRECLILPATKFRKMHTTRRDAFKPIDTTPIAKVDMENGTTEYYSTDYPKKENNGFKVKPFDPKLKVGIIYAHPNMYAEQFQAYEGWDGLVIAGTGLGHIPMTKTDDETSEHEKIFTAVKKLVENGTQVVMSTQTIFGRVDLNVYSPQRKLKESGVIGDLSDMTPETSMIKLAWLLSNHDKTEIETLYSQNLRGEISKRIEPNTYFWKEEAQ